LPSKALSAQELANPRAASFASSSLFAFLTNAFQGIVQKNLLILLQQTSLGSSISTFLGDAFQFALQNNLFIFWL